MAATQEQSRDNVSSIQKEHWQMYCDDKYVKHTQYTMKEYDKIKFVKSIIELENKVYTAKLLLDRYLKLDKYVKHTLTIKQIYNGRAKYAKCARYANISYSIAANIHKNMTKSSLSKASSSSKIKYIGQNYP